MQIKNDGLWTDKAGSHVYDLLRYLSSDQQISMLSYKYYKKPQQRGNLFAYLALGVYVCGALTMLFQVCHLSDE